MNLTTDPWIPILWKNGKTGAVSLADAFEDAGGIQDLAVRPHERIALMRLLICITQAALDGPKDYEDWRECRPLIVPSALDYLQRWRVAFELFGDSQRFAQVTDLKRISKGENLVSKLNFALATGDNTTVFDNSGGSERTFTPAELALMLTTFQCFSPGGTIGVASWNGHETRSKSDHAPCLPEGMLHSLIRGDQLLATVHGNLITKKKAEEIWGSDLWGKPTWEMMPHGSSDTVAVQNATHTYLGRLAPLARTIRLADDCRYLILANGLKYPTYPEWREASATIIKVKRKNEEERIVLGADLDKALWRELHALVVKAVGEKPGGAVALTNISDEAFDLWVGGLVAGQAKLLDATESVFHVPFEDNNNERVYEEGVRFAEAAAFRIVRAVSVYHKELGDDVDLPKMRNRRLQIQSNAITQYWTDIELAVPHLMDIAEHAEKLELDQWHKTTWGQSVWRFARAAYEHACPHETPRQIRAYALGLGALLATHAQRAVSETEQQEVER